MPETEWNSHHDSAGPEWAPVGFIHLTPSEWVSPLINCSSNTRLNQRKEISLASIERPTRCLIGAPAHSDEKLCGL